MSSSRTVGRHTSLQLAKLSSRLTNGGRIGRSFVTSSTSVGTHPTQDKSLSNGSGRPRRSRQYRLTCTSSFSQDISLRSEAETVRNQNRFDSMTSSSILMGAVCISQERLWGHTYSRYRQSGS